MKSRSILFFLTVFSGIVLISASETASTLQIIASGETHAMLTSCDCAVNPGGGLPKRSRLLSRLRSTHEIVLVDAGGFAGGGLYDQYTEGRGRDSVRTIITMQSMAAMRYDAVALGDEELQYPARWLAGQAQKVKLQLISANCKYTRGGYVGKPYCIVKKGNVTFGITAVTTMERLFPIDTAVTVGNPLQALKEIWSELKKKSTYQIILSHCGEEQTALFAGEFPGCKILVNGHRKSGTQPVTTVNDQHILQFGFQGKTLCGIDCNEGGISHSESGGWLPIADTIQDDPIIASLVTQMNLKDIPPKKTIVDLYIMSQCPYGIAALKEILALKEKIPALQYSVWFIGTIADDGALHSLRGGEEIAEEKYFLALKQLFPAKYGGFLYLYAVLGKTVSEALDMVGVDSVALKAWIAVHGELELANHYMRSQRMGVDASPTLYINNVKYEGTIGFFLLAKNICNDPGKYPPAKICDSLPECIQDSDCRMKGKVGLCIADTNKDNAGTCRYIEDVAFDFIIVVPDSPVVHSETPAVQTTQGMFPLVRLKTVSVNDSMGKRLVARFAPSNIPLYLFGKEVKKAYHFKDIESGLQETGNGEWLTFRPGVLKPVYFHQRMLVPHTVTLYVDPFFPDINKIIGSVFSKFPELKNVYIMPVIFSTSQNEGVGLFDNLRDEEALRWMVLQKYYPDVFKHYLRAYQKNPGSTYWFETLQKQHISLDEFVTTVRKSISMLDELRKNIALFEIQSPLVLVYQNRELIPVSNEEELERFLSIIKK